MTQLEQAKKNKITAQMAKVAQEEEHTGTSIRQKIAQGKVVIPFNKKRRPKKVYGIGEGLTTKINANIGTSSDASKIKDELKKMEVSIAAGAHTIMDLSTGGDIPRIRKDILQRCPVPVGTVPIYEAAVNSVKRNGSICAMKEDDIFDTIEQHAKDGVDFFTLHCGVTIESLARLKEEKRITDIVSRGGAILADWMIKNRKENPLYEYYERILDIAKRYDVTISLGDGMRPGSIADATDRTQIQELVLLGELAKQAFDNGVQTIIEGPGHVPLNQIRSNVVLQKRLCRGAPFYVLGPLVTDVAPGYDHITSAIGGAIAAACGADFLCYVTRSEHLRLPSIEDVKEGVIAARIAAHAADIAKGISKAIDWDNKISLARKKRDWKKQMSLSIDPQRPSSMRLKSKSKTTDACTMCSQYCSLKIMDQAKERLKKQE
ncbi:MAG: phosphomethylpyrimidine synthase ThiC [Candidatus Omnitrophica bacterium]|nr:phosphomethylpyrimidine synthase ThiC [Candidatus Omnitrophota bacterium]